MLITLCTTVQMSTQRGRQLRHGVETAAAALRRHACCLRSSALQLLRQAMRLHAGIQVAALHNKNRSSDHKQVGWHARGERAGAANAQLHLKNLEQPWPPAAAGARPALKLRRPLQGS